MPRGPISTWANFQPGGDPGLWSLRHAHHQATPTSRRASSGGVSASGSAPSGQRMSRCVAKQPGTAAAIRPWGAGGNRCLGSALAGPVPEVPPREDPRLSRKCFRPAPTWLRPCELPGACSASRVSEVVAAVAVGGNHGRSRVTRLAWALGRAPRVPEDSARPRAQVPLASWGTPSSS